MPLARCCIALDQQHRPRRAAPTSAACISSSGRAALHLGLVELAARGAARAARARASASSVRQRHPAAVPARHRAAAARGARFTYAVISCTRTNSSTRPAKMKRSPGFSRAMKPSSTCRCAPPREVLHLHRRVARRSCRCCMRWRLRDAARRARGTRRPRPATTRWYSGYAVRLAPPRATKSSAQSQLVAREVAVGLRVRTSASSSSATKPPPSATVTRCCTSTSSGLCGRSRASRCGRRSDRRARGRGLDQLERVASARSVTRDSPAGRVAAAPGALQQPRDALGAADLQHALDRQEVDAEVEADDVHDHRLQRAFLRARPRPIRALSRSSEPWCSAIMPGPVGPRLEQRLVPDLGLRAHVGEDQRRRRALDLVDHRLQHLRAEVAAPRKALDVCGHQRVDDDLPCRSSPAHEHGRRRRAEQHVAARRRGCRASPTGPTRRSRGLPAPQPRERELRPARRACCRSARATRRRSTVSHALRGRSRASSRVEHQGQALGRRDERRRAAAGPGARARPSGVSPVRMPTVQAGASAATRLAAARARCRPRARASA